MISKTPRKVQQPALQQDSHRKFGNIVNRQEKTTHFFPKCDQSNYQPFDRCHNTQNLRPHLASYSKQQKSLYSEIERSKIDNLFEASSKLSPSPIKEASKKQSMNRNREFVAKVENINKIHDQISSMLRYIKDGQSKSVIKTKQTTSKNETMKTNENIQRLIQQRMRQQKTKGQCELISTNRHKVEFQNNQLTQITPITQDEAIHPVNIKGGRPQPRRLQIEQNQKERAKINYSQNYKKPTNNYLDPKAIEKSTHELVSNIKETSKLNFNYNYNEAHEKEKKQKLYEYRQTTNPSPKRIPDKNYTPKKNAELTPRKQTYQYNFNSKEDPQQFIKNRRPNNFPSREQQKTQKNNFDYDVQISKVRERIQSSQQMTKKMQQRYLGSHRKMGNNQIGLESSSKYQLQQSIVTKNFQITNSKERNYQERNYQEKNNQERNHQEKSSKQQQYKGQSRKDFQLKVYPCHTPVQNDKLKKDEACKLISQKLSDQIKLDQRLRDAREVFNECKTEGKWKILQEKLSKLGFCFSQQQLENQLAISSSQSNPFSNQSSNSSNSVNQLAEAFAKSEQFWQNKLRKFISRSSLEKSGFNARQMDLDQRGYLSVEDLVCFINLHSSNFFRNRDMICLFRRMVALGKNRNGIQYENFLSIISQ